MAIPGPRPIMPASASFTEPAAPSNPHRRQTACTGPPRVPSLEAFGRRPSARWRIDRDKPASETLHKTGSWPGQSGLLLSAESRPLFLVPWFPQLTRIGCFSLSWELSRQDLSARLSFSAEAADPSSFPEFCALRAGVVRVLCVRATP